MFDLLGAELAVRLKRGCRRRRCRCRIGTGRKGLVETDVDLRLLLHHIIADQDDENKTHDDDDCDDSNGVTSPALK